MFLTWISFLDGNIGDKLVFMSEMATKVTLSNVDRLEKVIVSKLFIFCLFFRFCESEDLIVHFSSMSTL